MHALRVVDTAAEAPDSAQRVRPRTVADILADLDTLEPGTTGALVYGSADEPRGMVLLEGGRICWVTKPGMSARLRALIAEASTSPSARARVDEVFRACVRDRAPLGSALLAGQFVTAASLKHVFERQSAEALLKLASAGARPLGWIPRHQHAYQAPFTFSAGRLLAASSSVALPAVSAAASAEREEVLGAAAGVSFTGEAGGDPAMPVGMTAELELELAEAASLGRWATGAISRATVVAPQAPFVSASLGRGAALIAWGREALVHVALCTQPVEVAWVLTKLERRHRAGTQRDGER